MSDPQSPDAPPEKKAPSGHPTAPPSLLTKPGDQAVRPGFRSPPNRGTKASKLNKKK